MSEVNKKVHKNKIHIQMIKILDSSITGITGPRLFENFSLRIYLLDHQEQIPYLHSVLLFLHGTSDKNRSVLPITFLKFDVKKESDFMDCWINEIAEKRGQSRQVDTPFNTFLTNADRSVEAINAKGAFVIDELVSVKAIKVELFCESFPSFPRWLHYLTTQLAGIIGRKNKALYSYGPTA